MKLLPSLLVIAAALGCGPRGAKTPAEAHARLAAAVAAHDSVRLWNALDQDTRWAWMSIERAWRESYDITQSVVPEGSERSRLLARFAPGATAENAQVLFGRMLEPEAWAEAGRRLAAAGAHPPELDPSGDTARVVTPAGALVYRKAHDQNWGWGYSGLAARAEQLSGKAAADLERMRKDAADYERAAMRSSR
jgi:hypothetical protein